MKLKLINVTIIVLTLMLVLFSQCTESPQGPDVSTINKIDNLKRFDLALAKIDTNNLDNSLNHLSETFPALFSLYFTQIVPVLKEDDPEGFKSNILKMLRSKTYNKLVDTVSIEFPNVDFIQKELAECSQYFQHYFPEKEFPNFYTLIGEFTYQNFIFQDGTKDGIGIGLDMFLGENFPYKSLDPSNPIFSEYLTRAYNKDHLVRKTLESLALELVGDPNGKRLIDKMIHQGKKLYLLEKLLPTTPDSVIMEYSQAQLDWAYANEKEIWSYFIDKELMYETSHLKINRYIKEAPTSTGMPSESPGRTAQFIGRQIVRRYMEKNPDLSLKDLFSKLDSQKILESSNYKPRRKNS